MISQTSPLLLSSVVEEIETYCKTHGIEHRFVGGVSYGGLLRAETTYKIDVLQRTIILRRHNELSIRRLDNTIRDIDLILLTADQKKIEAFRSYITDLKWRWRGRLGALIPISYEGLLPLGQRVRGLLEFVTVLQTSGTHWYLAFDRVVQRVPKKSLEAWTVVLENGVRYTTRNPIADYYAYQFRSPAGIKPKDVEKLIHLSKLTKAVIAAGHSKHIDYLGPGYYGPWVEFISELEHSHIPSVQQKRAVTRWYWSTLGTTFSHGQGLVGKCALILFNFLNRVRK